MCPRFRAVLVTTAIAFAAGPVPPAFTQGTDRPTPSVDAILDAWKARLGKVKTARYIASGTSERMDVTPVVPQPTSISLLIDIPTGRIRVEKITKQPTPQKNFVTRHSIQSYDGKMLYSRTPREANGIPPDGPNLFHAKGNLTSLAYDGDIWPLLEAHGIVPLAIRPARPDRLPDRYDPEELTLHGTTSIQKRTCVVLRSAPTNTNTPMFDEIMVDPERECAPVRHIFYNGKNPWLRLEADYQRGERGWMPKAWTCAQTIGGKLIERITYHVDKVEYDGAVRDEEFIQRTEPGDVLWVDNFPEAGKGLNPNLPARTKFKTDPTGATHETDKTGFVTAEGVVLPPENGSQEYIWWAAVVFGAAVIFALFRPWRWISRRRNS